MRKCASCRVGRALAWLRADLTGDNGYARPIGGLLAIVDLGTMQVIRIDDHGALPVPAEHGDYRDGGGRPYRDDLRPIEVTQPEGSSLALDGRALTWGPWRLRVGFNPRESLTLHELAFDAGDGSGARPIAHRLSIAELAIPYADTNPTVVFKNAFDIGEYGIGPYANSLALGCDCLGEITYLDAVVHDSQGRPLTIANAICLHEEDTGILWKHHDWRSGATDVRRARRLVISTIVTVGNYEYGLYWYLALDGGIAFEAKLTGVLHTAGVAGGRAVVLGHARRAGRQRRLPPALLLRAPRPRHRRRAQRPQRGRLAQRPAGAGQPAWAGLHGARDAARERARRTAADRPALGPALARGQPRAPQSHGDAGRVRARAGDNVALMAHEDSSSPAGRAS